MTTTSVREHTRKVKNKRVKVKKHFRSYKRKSIPDSMTVRALHQDRTVEDRELDEKTTEKLVDRDKWIKAPDKYDFRNVDTALPEKYSVYWHGDTMYVEAEGDDPEMTEEKFNEGMKEWGYEESLVTDLGGTIAYIRSGRLPNNKSLISAMFIDNAYRGKGLSNYMMRETTKHADKNGITLVLKAQPFEISSIGDSPDRYEYDPYILEKEDTEALVKYYEEFGFKKNGKMDKEDDIYYQRMTRRPQKK